ncbi:MAG: hypothetical protein KBF43_14990 [Dermatophilaceae bacterium]|nr:hypothetical protein [Actinomycetales bacterium]MBP8881808.1 hypothetical protein [Dermatophilaceae bacterium]MBP9919890.1 hypothetical protein [Dermatophilaceae bacterium]
MPDAHVILFDVNALVALTLTTHQHHGAAHRFLAGLPGHWATCPLTESSLFRLLLNPAVTGSQRAVGDITAIVRGIRAERRWRFLTDDASLADPDITTEVLMGHHQVTDLHLVNVAARHGAVLATFDAAIPTWLAPADRRHVLVIPV